MYSQMNNNRFGVVLGAGVGKPLGYPDWKELIQRIANDPKVADTDLLRILEKEKRPLPIQAQILFGRFRDKHRQDENLRHLNESEAIRILRADWRNIVHHCLYADAPPSTTLESVYSQFVDVVRRSTMTVNYNFDDTLERLLLEKKSEDERGYETVVDARLQFQRNTAIIYHPNGFLPRSRFDNPSDYVVLTEDSFGDQLIDSMSGQFAALANHFSKNTCLLIGLSLEDQTLRHLLRQHARMNPGHVHYYVRFVDSVVRPDEDTCSAERDANFEVFNLVTLFLDRDELASLGRLLVMPEIDIASFDEPSAYCFYLSGVPGTGKTTTASFLRNLITYDEWVEARPESLAKPHDELTIDERQLVDDWILKQIGIKNKHLVYDSQSRPVGVRLVDRCLTDPIAFTEHSQWRQKARAVRTAIAKHNRPPHPGHVVVLEGDPQELAVRVMAQNKQTSVDYTTKLQRDMQMLYPNEPGITHLDLTGYSVHEAVKRIARLVHLEPYVECDIGELIRRVESGVIAPG